MPRDKQLDQGEKQHYLFQLRMEDRKRKQLREEGFSHWRQLPGALMWMVAERPQKAFSFGEWHMVGGDVSVYSYALWSTLGIRGLDLCSTHFSGGCHLERAWEPGSTCLSWGSISEWVWRSLGTILKLLHMEWRDVSDTRREFFSIC